MYVSILKGKIHLARVTECNIEYQGSCGIDRDWMDQVGILPNEQIHILNQNNGERFITYAIPEPRGTKRIRINGAAARKAVVGDRVIIVAYGHLSEEQAKLYQPKILNLAKT